MFRKRIKSQGLAEEFARRLARAVLLREKHAAMLNDYGRRLIDHAAFSAFLDLRALGASSRQQDTGRGAGDGGESPPRQPISEGGLYESL